MDKWQQSLNGYTSVPVYFDRSIIGQNTMETKRNYVKAMKEMLRKSNEEADASIK